MLRPLVAKNNRGIGDPQLTSGFQAQMAIDHRAVAACQDRDLEPEFSDVAAHAIYGCVVLAGIASIENQLVDRPVLDLLRHCLCGHRSSVRADNGTLPDSIIRVSRLSVKCCNCT